MQNRSANTQLNKLRNGISFLRRLLLDHDYRHEDGGGDEIDLTGLSGEPGDAVAKSLFDAKTFLYATIDDTPEAKTPVESMAILVSQSEETANFTAGDETVLYADATTGPIKVSLEAAVSRADKWYWIKKIDSSDNKVTIDPYGTETIDGLKTIELTLQYQYVMIHTDGTEWFILGGEYVKMEEILERLLGLQLEELEEIKKNTKNAVTQLETASDEEIEED